MVSRLVFSGYAGSVLPWYTTFSGSLDSVSNMFLWGFWFPGFNSLFEFSLPIFLPSFLLAATGTTLFLLEGRRSKTYGISLRTRRLLVAGLLLLLGAAFFVALVPSPLIAAPSRTGPTQVGVWSAGLWITFLTGVQMINSAFKKD